MVCVISIAVDTGEKEQGDIIGLPLENRWKKMKNKRAPVLTDLERAILASITR
jgi:hypothetical protein